MMSVVAHADTHYMSLPQLLIRKKCMYISSLFFSVQVGCMQVILSWHTSPQQLSWSVLNMLGVKAFGAPSMSSDTTSKEAAGSSQDTQQSVHATCGQCMCMKRCWGSTGQR